jgi:hypothetical protein
MTEVLDFLRAFNIQTIFSLAVIVWYFSRRIENEFKSEMKVLEGKIDKQSERTDRLYEMFIDLLKEKK